MTENEKKVLELIVNSEYQNGDNPVNCPVWLDCISDDFGSCKTFSGTMSQLVQKGLVESDGECCSITEKGMSELKL